MRNLLNTDYALRLLEEHGHPFNDFDGASTADTFWGVKVSGFPRPLLT